VVSKKLIFLIIIGVIVVGFAIFYFAYYPVLVQEQVESKISEYYQKYLNREPDSNGLSHYKQIVLEGNSLEWVEEQIKNSHEAQIVKFRSEVKPDLAEFYTKYLERDLDHEGLNYFSQMMLEGKSLEWVENEINHSPEAQVVKFQNEVKPQLVEFYAKYLERDLDSEGLNYFSQMMLEGKSLEWVENEIKNSPEANMIKK